MNKIQQTTKIKIEMHMYLSPELNILCTWNKMNIVGTFLFVIFFKNRCMNMKNYWVGLVKKVFRILAQSQSDRYSRPEYNETIFVISTGTCSVNVWAWGLLFKCLPSRIHLSELHKLHRDDFWNRAQWYSEQVLQRHETVACSQVTQRNYQSFTRWYWFTHWRVLFFYYQKH